MQCSFFSHTRCCYRYHRRPQLFGYDVLVDENLRPWLLEVNASPSLGASNRDDLRLKKQMVGDVFDIIDVEGRLERDFLDVTL